MPRKDDERRPRQGDVTPPRPEGVVKIFGSERKPEALRSHLESLWQRTFKEENPVRIGQARWHSWQHQPGIYLALEHLRRLGEIPDTPVFDTEGRLRQDAHPHDVELLFGKDGILKGKRVVVFGGPEAEVFQAMGAEAVGYDPVFGKKEIKSIPWKARQLGAEIEERAEDAVGLDNGWADLTYSSSLFDPGSGLADDAGRYAYTMNLWVVLNLTKVGGLSIHDGNGIVPAILPEFDKWPFDKKMYREIEAEVKREVIVYKTPARIMEIAPRFADDKVGSQETTYVLQRTVA